MKIRMTWSLAVGSFGGVLLAGVITGGCSDRHAAPKQDTRGGIARQVSAAAAQPQYAPAVAPLPGALDYLSAYAGRNAAQAGLWTTRPLHERLVAMLGVEYERFIAQMPAGKLVSDSGIFYVAGHTERGVAAIVIDPRADSIYAIEQDTGGRREYLERSHKPPLPGAVRDLLVSIPLR